MTIHSTNADQSSLGRRAGALKGPGGPRAAKGPQTDAFHDISPPEKILVQSGQATNPGRLPVGGRLKRCVDVVVASVALLLAAPLMITVAILIKAATRGPIVFAHERIGFNGQPFKCYKFCTMVVDAEAALREYLAQNPEAAAEWEETRKLKRDPRVTILGRILRLSSLDELPQLFNILRGDMSCVGPRPVVADELPLYGTSVADYLGARPGLTGLWQVVGRGDVEYARRVMLDSHYVRNWSLGFDIIILFRTIFAVMRFEQTS